MANKNRIFTTVDDVYKALDDNISVEEKFLYSHPTKTKGKSIKLSLGRIWFNMLLPSDFDLVDTPVTSKDLSKIIIKLNEKYSPEEASDYLTTLSQNFFRMSSYIPASFDVDSLILSDHVKAEKEKIKKEKITDPNEFDKRVTEITKEIEKDMDAKSRSNYFNLSGAKDVPWKQLMVAQGFVSDIESNLHGPITTAIADGNNPVDFYTSAAESRRGFFYSATRSAIKEYKVAA